MTSSPTACSEHHMPRGSPPKTRVLGHSPFHLLAGILRVGEAPGGQRDVAAGTRAESVLMSSGRIGWK